MSIGVGEGILFFYKTPPPPYAADPMLIMYPLRLKPGVYMISMGSAA